MTDFGPVSALICGENSNPLAQYAAALSYPVFHVAIRDSVREYLIDLREQRKGAMIFTPLGQLIACGDGNEEVRTTSMI